MKTMKLLSALMALLMIIGLLTACGGSANTNDAPKDADTAEADAQVAEAPLHCGWYYANIPDGFTATDEEEAEFETADGKKTISCYLFSTFSDTPDAAAVAAEKVEDSDFYTLGDPVTIGDYTWQVVNFTWDDDAPCCDLYADIYEGRYAEVTMFGLTPDDAEAKVFLESFKLKEGDPDDNQQAFYGELYQ